MLVDTLVRFALLGSSWVLYGLLLLSVVSFAAMAERALFFRKNRASGEGLHAAVRRAMESEGEKEVLAVLERSTAIEARVVRQALAFRSGGASAVSDAAASAIARERAHLERSMTLLGTLGNNAPFIGLFGTVLGVIEAFAHLGTGDAGAMGSVMSGIADALVATGVGIFVAIPAVVAFNAAQKKIGDIENDADALTKLVSAWLTTRERGGSVEGNAAASRPAISTAPSAPSEARDVALAAEGAE